MAQMQPCSLSFKMMRCGIRRIALTEQWSVQLIVGTSLHAEHTKNKANLHNQHAFLTNTTCTPSIYAGLTWFALDEAPKHTKDPILATSYSAHLLQSFPYLRTRLLEFKLGSYPSYLALDLLLLQLS